MGTEKNDLFNATTLNTLQDADVLLDSTTTDSDILNATLTTANVAARIHNIETINVTGEYVTTGLVLTNVSGTKTLNLDTKLVGGTATVTDANSINAAAIKAGANISTLNVNSLSSGTRDTVTVDGGNANVKLTGQTGGADKYSVTIAKDKTLTANTMNSSGDELTVNASNNFKLDTNAAISTATINNTGSAAITVEATSTTANNIATKLNLSGNAVTLKGDASAFVGTAATGAGAGVEVTSTATKSTIELSSGTIGATGAFLNKAQVSEVLVSAEVTGAGALANVITVNENSKLVLDKDQKTNGVIANIDNVKGTLATTGTLLLDVNASQTKTVETGANVDTVLLTAGKLPDKDGKAQAVTIAEFKTDTNTDTIVVNGANDLVITKLSSGDADTVAATAHTGKLTINSFDKATKVFSGSNDDTFKVGAATTAILEINSGAGNDTVDLGVSTAANQITLGAGNDTVVFAAAAGRSASTIKDAVIGEDKIILTGTANNGAALNVAALGAITAGNYTNAFGTAHAFKLTDSTATDLSNLVQFGNSTAAYTAAKDLALTTGSFNDVVELTATSSGNINLGAGDDKITTGATYTGTITGGAGSDTFVINSTVAAPAGAKIADLGATDILKVAASGVVTVDVVESFTATAATSNAVAATAVTLTLKDGVNVDMTLATVSGTAGYNIKTDDAVNTGATIVGSRGIDTIIGSKFADTITGGEGVDTITAGAGADTIILTENFSAGDIVKFTAVSDSAASIAANTTVTFDTIKDFVTTADKLNIAAINTALTGGGAATGATVTAVGTSGAGSLADTTIADFAELKAAIDTLGLTASATGAAGANTGIQAYLIDLTGNTGALGTGKYLVINNNNTTLDANDVMIQLTGTTTTVVGTDFDFTA